MGEVPLENNKKIHFKGRQMQTIEVDGFNKGVFLKFLLKKNHLNRYNEYNQVGLMGLNVIGTPIDKDKHSEKPLYKLSHRDDLAFLMYMDTDIAEVRELLRPTFERRQITISLIIVLGLVVSMYVPAI